jgi:hypothetical protein
MQSTEDSPTQQAPEMAPSDLLSSSCSQIHSLNGSSLFQSVIRGCPTSYPQPVLLPQLEHV